MPLYYPSNFRTEQQREEMLRLEEHGICVFCPEHVDNDHPLVKTAHWAVLWNKFPYQGARQHLLLVPKEHVTGLLDLSAPARDDFWVAMDWVRERFGLAHYGLGARNGDPRFTGGTIYHLHVHVLVGDVEDPDHQGIRMKLSSRPTHDQP